MIGASTSHGKDFGVFISQNSKVNPRAGKKVNFRLSELCSHKGGDSLTVLIR